MTVFSLLNGAESFSIENIVLGGSNQKLCGNRMKWSGIPLILHRPLTNRSVWCQLFRKKTINTNNIKQEAIVESQAVGPKSFYQCNEEYGTFSRLYMDRKP